MLYVNLYGPQLLYSACKFGQVFLTCTASYSTYLQVFMEVFHLTEITQKCLDEWMCAWMDVCVCA